MSMDNSSGGPTDALPVPVPPSHELELPPLEEALLGDIDHLEAVVVPLHPDIQPNFDYYRFSTTGHPGQSVFFLELGKENPKPQEGQIVAGGGLVLRGLDQAGEATVAPISFKPGANLIGITSEEVEQKFERLQEQHAYRQHVIETHRLGKGGPTLINSLGGLSVGSDEAVHETSKDLVIRSVTGLKFGCTTIEGLVDQHLLDPVLANILGARLSPLIQEASKGLSVMDSLPEETRTTVGKPILEAFFEKIKVLVGQAEPEVLVLAAIRAADPENARHAALMAEHELQYAKENEGGFSKQAFNLPIV